MPTHPKLEAYLTSLDRALQGLPVSERADILIEMKSHVLSAQERDPNLGMDAILAALGEPETVANRYLMEQGKKPIKPPVSPIVKWIILGFLGALAMLLIFAGTMVFHFSGKVKMDSDSFSFNMNASTHQGDFPWAADEVRPIIIRASNSKMTFQTSESASFSWDCKGPKDKKFDIKENPGDIVFDLSTFSGVKCDLHLPEKSKVTLDSGNMKLSLEEPRFHLSAKITNGKVDIDPDTKSKYRFDMSVVNGKVDAFESSNDPEAFKLNIQVINGRIAKAE